MIANRGEIAVRIARTAHRLGIDTVGVYSATDARAVHVNAVDSAVALGGQTAAESYLRGESIIAAALAAGCDAIHPGYGFLAENADFAQKVVDAGLVWVGPTPDQIRILGNKVAAKHVAIAAGVPTTEITEVAPGSIPDGISMPALVKAAAGGGGRGMRVVRTPDELADAVEAAAREAQAAFGDSTVFVEPLIEDGRHIEVQIIGDSFGNVIHLGERECSIQRRNQKVVEEAPSAGITDETRQIVLAGAVALAKSVGYQNAGTVEFLVGADGTITFLEVNTRLQVEHPVTEAVTGLDLVELQLIVASSGSLPVTQDDVSITGHAIEVRLVAEDPTTGWIPSTGTIMLFHIPGDMRVDTGFDTGSEVSPYYDSLLAKVISHGRTRGEAAAALARSLRTTQVVGISTNANMLVALLAESDFLAANTPTSYLLDHPEVEADTGVSGDDRLALLLGAVFASEFSSRAADAVTGFAPSGWRNLRTTGQRQEWNDGGEVRWTELVMGHDTADVLIGAWPRAGDDGSLQEDTRRHVSVRLLDRGPQHQVIEIDGIRARVETVVDGDSIHCRSAAGVASFALEPRFEVHRAVGPGAGPVSPLPGTVIAVHTEVGDEVTEGQLLMVVEAMKMEHQITASADGLVTEVLFTIGDRVSQGDLLVKVGPP
ncbi:MAG: ATP-grasp domain-containing protein [Acidimicrobiia bacterium]|nr:ATP-grasp domain-containing protein [Acidimicrobiia bacterium]